MAKQSAESTKPASEAANGLAALNQISVDMFSRGMVIWMESATKINREWMGFVGSRLRRDAELAEKMAKCANWSEASQFQQEWIKQTAEEYSAESGKLTEVAVSVAADGMKPLTQGTEQVFGALNGSGAA